MSNAASAGNDQDPRSLTVDECAHAGHVSLLKDEFLATVSHELRAPVAAILAWATFALAHPDMDPRKVIETIEQNARSQARLIDDVLDVSRIVTGKLKLELQPIDLTVVLRAALDTVTPAAIAKGVMLDVRVASDPFDFHGDADRLQQVIWNLLSNAIKFTPKDGRIEIRLSRVGAAAEMVVHDTGCGIAADLLSRVFERFRQGSSAGRTAGGLGLGLTIARYLVELHGGTVTAQSDGEGRGATLTVVLPIRPSAPGGSDHASQQGVVGDAPRRPSAGLARRIARDRQRRRARRVRSRDARVTGSNLTNRGSPSPSSESDVDGDGERERRALSEGALDPDLAAVPLDDAPADGQAEPDARDRRIA
jgi:anti-sigma regulatory factor (Ser/Thr protein kinase)